MSHELQSLGLRPYQIEAVKSASRVLRDPNRPDYGFGPLGPLLVMATGTGKTRTALGAVILSLRKGHRVLWLAHRSELLFQARDTAYQMDPETILASGSTLFMAGHPFQSGVNLVFGSTETMVEDGRIDELFKSGRFNICVWDEAHHSGTDRDSYVRSKLIESGCVHHIGLTATPEGDRLGRFWALAYELNIRDAQKMGHLRREKIIDCAMPPGETMTQTQLVDHCVNMTEFHLRGRRPLIFTDSIPPGRKIVEGLKAAGWTVDMVTGNDSKKARARAIEGFRSGKIQALVNAAVLTEGTDLPMCDAVVLARACQSKSLYIQIVGRALRPYGDIADGLVVDLLGASRQYKDMQIAPVLSVEDEPKNSQKEELDEEIQDFLAQFGDGDNTDNEEDEERKHKAAKIRPPKVHWVEVDKHVHAADGGQLGVVFMVRLDTDPVGQQWRLAWMPRKARVPRWCPMLSRPGLNRDMVAMLGGDALRQAKSLVRHNAAWRADKATPDQRRYALERCGIIAGQYETKGELADRVTAHIGRERWKDVANDLARYRQQTQTRVT